jgi:hypothetical protein
LKLDLSHRLPERLGTGKHSWRPFIFLSYKFYKEVILSVSIYKTRRLFLWAVALLAQPASTVIIFWIVLAEAITIDKVIVMAAIIRGIWFL